MHDLVEDYIVVVGMVCSLRVEARVVVGLDLPKETRENVDKDLKTGLIMGHSGLREALFPVCAWVQPLAGSGKGRKGVAALTLGGGGSGSLGSKDAPRCCRGRRTLYQIRERFGGGVEGRGFLFALWGHREGYVVDDVL